MITVDNTVLVVVDIQEKLTRVMSDKEALVENAVKLVRGANVLGVPVICTEQNPKGLGPTIPELRDLMSDVTPVSKFSFSCCGEKTFMTELDKHDREFVLACGIESHVCLYQTVADLIDLGYEVDVVSDVVSSRTPENRRIGLDKCKEYGAWMSGVEMALFELLQVAEGEKFKEIIKIVK